MKASLLSPGVLSSILGSRMVFGMIPGFYDYETFIESFLRFEPGTYFGCGRRIDQLAILAFSFFSVLSWFLFELGNLLRNIGKDLQMRNVLYHLILIFNICLICYFHKKNGASDSTVIL